MLRDLREWVLVPCFRVVIPTPPQANEVKMSVFATLEDPWLEIRLFEWDLLRLELSRMMAC